MSTSVRVAASLTATAFGIATIGFGIAAATTTAGTVAIVAFAALAILCSAASISSISAWISDDSKDVPSYFSTMGKHMLLALPGIINFVAQTIIQALVQGVTQGITRNLSRRMGGDDYTSTVTHKYANGTPPR